MYATPCPAAEKAALLEDVKRMSLANSLTLLLPGIPREY